MLYSLYRRDGECQRVTAEVWHGALRTAQERGWEPAGTVLEEGGPWHGTYRHSRCGQVITAEDSQNLCKALAGSEHQRVGEFIGGRKTYIF